MYTPLSVSSDDTGDTATTRYDTKQHTPANIQPHAVVWCGWLKRKSRRANRRGKKPWDSFWVTLDGPCQCMYFHQEQQESLTSVITQRQRERLAETAEDCVSLSRLEAVEVPSGSRKAGRRFNLMFEQQNSMDLLTETEPLAELWVRQLRAFVDRSSLHAQAADRTMGSAAQGLSFQDSLKLARLQNKRRELEQEQADLTRQERIGVTKGRTSQAVDTEIIMLDNDIHEFIASTPAPNYGATTVEFDRHKRWPIEVPPDEFEKKAQCSLLVLCVAVGVAGGLAIALTMIFPV